MGRKIEFRWKRWTHKENKYKARHDYNEYISTGAAWWTMASHLAAQDYLARLQASAAAGGISFGGLPGAESLVPSYPLLSAPHSQAHGLHKFFWS